MNEVGAVLVTGVAAVVVTVWGILSQRAISRRRATLDFIARTESDADLIEARQTFISLARAPGSLAPWADEAKEKLDEVRSIRLVLNEFELIAIGIQRGIIDSELYRRWYRSGTIQYWTFAAPFILALRARTNNDALYHEFEEMVRWFRDNRMPRRNIWSGRFF